MKNIITTIDILRGYKEYKRHGKTISIPLIELFRPQCENLLNIEVLIGIYLYLKRSTKQYAKCGNVYGLRWLTGEGMYGILLGGTRNDMQDKLINVIREMILLESTHTEIDEWRRAEEIDINCTHEMTFKHYRNKKSWPLWSGDFDKSLADLLAVSKGERFEWNVNSSWKSRARCIIGKYFRIYPDGDSNAFTYCINYSTTFKEASSWELKILSNPHESFVDFVIRLSKHNFREASILNHIEKDGVWGYKLNK